MAKELSQWINTQISRKDIKPTYIFRVNSIDYSNFLVGWNIQANKEFGSATATFTLNNNSGDFSDGGSDEIAVGTVVEFIEKFAGDNSEFKRFYGKVYQRVNSKSANERTLVLSCLDYIADLKNYDIDLLVEGTKTAVTNEVLTPNYLSSPNESLAQVFDFANTGIAEDPRPIIMIRDKTNMSTDIQFDGFQILYETGQLMLGSPLNALDNYEILAREYSYYVEGVYAEDILEDILTQEDGYGGYMFGEASAQDVIDNHFIETFYNMEAKATDTLIPNYVTTTITIRHTLASDITAGDTSIILDSTEGLPDNGQGEINGDIFTWTGVSSGTTLTGIPATGTYSLKAHNSGDIVKYENTYAIGQIWYLTYSNIQSELDSGDFNIPSGSTIDYIDYRFGRIILDSAISTSSTIECTNNYSFKTLQATGIELNKISFRSRELENRYEAINKLREYVAPNWIIRTQGDNKVWASYLRQKRVADYDLKLIQDLSYSEDEDLYTRVVFYGKNNNPTNVMYSEDVNFIPTGQTFTAFATNNELLASGEEGNYYIYSSGVSGQGHIQLETFIPVVKINGVPIDNQVHKLQGQQCLVQIKTKTVTRTGCHGTSSEFYVKSHTYFYYTVYFSHIGLVPSEPIYLYDQTGTLLYTLSPYDPNVDYGNGKWVVPGTNQNTTIETISTADYSILYASNLLVIDYDNILFKISKSLITNPSEVTVTASYEYWTVFTSVFDVAAVIDGRFNTQVQTVFYSEPPSGFPLTILDMGAIYDVQAIDIVAGFFKPDDTTIGSSARSYDIDMRFSLKYSLDNISYHDINDETNNIKLSGGEAISFEEDDLGGAFQARYFRIDIEGVKKIDYDVGVWPIAFTEFAVYNNIVIKSEAKLIPTTQLTQAVTYSDTVIYVTSTEGFDEPTSGGDVKTAYINESEFTYTGLTSTTFTGVSGIDSGGFSIGDRVHQEVEGDDTRYDDSGLLPKLGDKLYKYNLISDDALYSQTELDGMTGRFLEEFIKNHSRRTASVIYTPYLNIGDTITLTDSYGNVVSERCFIESITDRNGFYELDLAKYPE